jgi:nucleoid DNA-binding protein
MNQKVISESGFAKKLERSLNDKLVNQNEFYDHLNETVFKPILGVEITRGAAKDLIVGISNQILAIVLSNGRVRIGRLGTFAKKVYPPSHRYNPVSDEHFTAPERERMIFRPSKSTQRLFKD